MRWKSIATLGVAACACALSTLTACQTLQQLTALQNVSFELDGIRDVRLAGVRLDAIQSPGDLGLTSTAQILAAYASGRLPLELTADVVAENPSDNSVTARLAQLDWTIFLEGKETISGGIGSAVSLPPGAPTMIPISAGLDVLEFFDGSGQDLLDLVLSLTGQEGGSSKELAIQLQPTIETPLGPMRYPRPITVYKETVGGDWH